MAHCSKWLSGCRLFHFGSGLGCVLSELQGCDPISLVGCPCFNWCFFLGMVKGDSQADASWLLQQHGGNIQPN